jgi:hypothetical protein
MTCSAVEVNPVDAEIFTGFHPPFVEIFEAEWLVVGNSLDAASMAKKWHGREG